jgi:uncharacterized protein (TIGR02646 family)
VIRITRAPSPRVLVDSAAQWTADFLERRKNDPRARPNSARYAHKEIRDALSAMTHHKCSYCEVSTKPTEEQSDRPEVDHHVDIAAAPERAYDWTNLYWSCSECNGRKRPEHEIAVGDCVDPCGTWHEPVDHMTFRKETIRGLDERGTTTIVKYRLDRPELDYRRAKMLNLYLETRLSIQDQMLREGRGEMRDAEKRALQAFLSPEQPFAMMLRQYAGN